MEGIHVTGAAGAGVTTLGGALAGGLGYEHLDTDDFYWLPTDPPYREKRDAAARITMLKSAFDHAKRGWVLSGSIGDWGEPLILHFGLVIYLYTPLELRLRRLAERETRRFGDEIAPGGRRHEEYRAFMDWAAGYEPGGRPGRTKAFHEGWLRELRCPVRRLDGSEALDALVSEARRAWEACRPGGGGGAGAISSR